MPTLASSNRTQLTYKPEAVPGTVVNGTACSALRMTGETLNFNVKKESDKEIRSDRQRVSSVTVGAQVDGAINVHMQYGEYDPLLAAVLQGSWVAAGTNGVATSAATSYTATTIVATATLPQLVKGQWFQASHPSHLSGAKVLLKCSSSIAPTTSLITLDAATPLATVASGSVTIGTSRLTNGSSPKSFTFELKYSDLASPVFMVYKGVYPSKFSTTFTSGGLTEANFDLMGMGHSSGLASALHATVNASQTFDVQNAVTGVGNIWENGAPLTSTFIKSMTLNFDNALRGQEAIGTLGLVGIGTGTFSASGTIDVYFADGSLYNKFIGDVYTSLSVSTQDSSGNGYVFTFPRVQLTSAKIDAGGRDQDVMASFNWEAFADVLNVDPTLRQTVFIDRFGVAVVPVV